MDITGSNISHLLVILSMLEIKGYVVFLTEDITKFLIFFVVVTALTIAFRHLSIIDNKIFATLFIYIL